LTADAENTLCNRPDARVASPDTLKYLLEVLAVSLDARSGRRLYKSKFK